MTSSFPKQKLCQPLPCFVLYSKAKFTCYSGYLLTSLQSHRIHRRTIKKDLHDLGNNDGVITHLEPDILECKVKWALGSITTNKASGGDGIPVELFQMLKDDAVKVLHSICQQIESEVKWALESITMNEASGGAEISVELFQMLTDDAVKVLHSICQQIWKTQQWPQDFIPIPKKGNDKKCPNYHTIALISHASKVMLKILQVRLQQYVNREFPDVQSGFRKAENQRSNCQHPLDHQKSKRVPEKQHFLLY